MYRADGDPDFAPVGETEFVNGIAAMSASGAYGPARVCSGIVGYADLQLGERAERPCRVSSSERRLSTNQSARWTGLDDRSFGIRAYYRRSGGSASPGLMSV
jgi:L-fuconolactonase